MNDFIDIKRDLQIPTSELQFKFSRSGGKGGQHVNKVETKVELLFDVRSSPTLSEDQRYSIIKNLENQIDSKGILHVVSQSSRSQWKNREAAIKKFIELLQKALQQKKKRKKTKLPILAKTKRLEAKKHRGEIKKMRRFIL